MATNKRDAYATRQVRKKASGQGCMVTLLVGGGLLAGLSLLLGLTAGWLV